MDQQQAMPQQQAPQQQPVQNNEFELSFGATLKNCWGYLKDNAGVYVGLYALTILPFFLAGIFLAIGFLSGVEETTTPTTSSFEVQSDPFDTTSTTFEFESETFGTSETATGTLNLDEVNFVMVGIGSILMIAGLLLAMVVQAGVIAASLKIMREKTKVGFSEAFALGRQNFGRFFVVAFVSGLIIMGGFILFIVPGFIFMMWYYVATASSIDNKTGLGEALKDSKRLTEGHRLTIFGIVIGTGIISSVIGNVPVVGQIISAIISLIATLFVPYIYLSLKKMKDGAQVGTMQPAMAGAPEMAQPMPAQPMQQNPQAPQPVEPTVAAPSPTAPEAPNSNENVPPTA